LAVQAATVTEIAASEQVVRSHGGFLGEGNHEPCVIVSGRTTGRL